MAGFGINLCCSYHTHHVVKHRGKTEDKMGKGIVQVQDAQHALAHCSCPFSVSVFDKLWKWFTK